MRYLNLYGNHRGGSSIVRSLTTEVARQYDRRWTLADPKEGRAAQLAQVIRGRFPFTQPRALQSRAEEMINRVGATDAVVLALDTARSTSAVLRLRQRHQVVSFQLVGRGPGGNGGLRMALQGTLLPDDTETQREAGLLLDALESMTIEASSRALTETDRLSATVLGPMRRLAAEQTALHLAEIDRAPAELTHGPLSIAFGSVLYPLAVVKGEAGESHTRRVGRALERSGRMHSKTLVDRGALGLFCVVAIAVPAQRMVELQRVVVNHTGYQRVIGTTMFRPRPSLWDSSNSLVPGSAVTSGTAALFTD